MKQSTKSTLQRIIKEEITRQTGRRRLHEVAGAKFKVGDVVIALDGDESEQTIAVVYPNVALALAAAINDGDPDAAEQLALTAQRLKDLQLIDTIVPEPVGAAHRDYEAMMANMNKALARALSEVEDLSEKELLERRHQRFMSYGQFKEVKAKDAN